MEIRMEIITMPDIDEVRATSILRSEQIVKEQQEKQDYEAQRATDDLPRFIRFINAEIDKAKMNGLRCVSFSYNNENWFIKDPRCSFTFKGVPNYKHAKFVEALYKELGFEGWVHDICCNTNRAYRDGHVHLYW